MPSFKEQDEQNQNTKTNVAKHKYYVTIVTVFSLCKIIWHLGTLQHNENFSQFIKDVPYTVRLEHVLSKSLNRCHVCFMYILIGGISSFMQALHTKHYYSYLSNT